NVGRGHCRECATPVVDVFRLPPLGAWSMFPRALHENHDGLLTPLCHTFYDRRVREVTDNLPRHSGYWRSHLAFFVALLKASRGARA
ncbi:MAG: hypothetical protein AAGD86_01235, partial [Pseudomonadota bacterium]